MPVAIVTRHALRRVSERDPVFAAGPGLRKRVQAEVVDALAAGRVSKRCPVWARRAWLEARRPRAKTPDRFAWSSDDARCYVLRKAHRRDDATGRIPVGDTGWLVITTFVAGMGEIAGVAVRRPTRISRR